MSTKVEFAKTPAQSATLHAEWVRTRPPSLPWGVETLDDPETGILGMEAGNVYTIIARTGNGKSTFARAVALAQAKLCSDDEIVAIINWEGTVEQVEAFLHAALSQSLADPALRYTAADVARHRVTREQVLAAAALRAKQPIVVLGQTFQNYRAARSMTLERAYEDILRLCDDHNKRIRLIVADHLHEIPSADKRSRREELADVSFALRDLSNAAQAPVLLAAQANRQTDERGVPGLASAEGASTIEQSPSFVAGLMRPKIVWPTKPDFDLPGMAKVPINYKTFVIRVLKSRMHFPPHATMAFELNPATLQMSSYKVKDGVVVDYAPTPNRK